MAAHFSATFQHRSNHSEYKALIPYIREKFGFRSNKKNGSFRIFTLLAISTRIEHLDGLAQL